MKELDQSRPSKPSLALDATSPPAPPPQTDQKRPTMPTASASPDLSRYDPMARIIAFDDFDRGFCGWTQLVGNYEGTLDSMLPSYVAHTQPQLSNVTHWDAGSHGAFDGTYALKIATRPHAGARNVAIKRLTFRKPSPVRLEFYFAFKPEASELLLSETDVKSIGFCYDLQQGSKGGNRVMPHFRFLNASDGEHVQKWQYKDAYRPFSEIGTEGKTVSFDHLADIDWKDVPGGSQTLCYNEVPTKINWHYVRFDFDLATMKPVLLQCNDHTFDVSGLSPIVIPAMNNLWCMMNILFFAEAATDKRTFLYIDSVCLSGDF